MFLKKNKMSLFQYNINQILNKENKEFFVKYILISILGYLFIFLSLFILIDLFKMNKAISFLIVYAVNYMFLYVVQLKYLFKKKHDRNKIVRFYGTLLFFYFLANMLYNLGIYLRIHYFFSTLLTIVILMPFRFIVSKFFVFKD